MKRRMTRTGLITMLDEATLDAAPAIPHASWLKAYNRFQGSLCRLTCGECSTAMIREVNQLSIELRALEKRLRWRSPQGSLPLLFCVKARELVQSELNIFSLRLNHPALDCCNKKNIRSPLFLSKEYKATDLVEFITPIFELGILTTFDGKPAQLNTIVRVFEKAFNVQMPNYRILREGALSRKKYLTPLLDKFKAIMIDISQR